jgi:hypothetical protein
MEQVSLLIVIGSLIVQVGSSSASAAVATGSATPIDFNNIRRANYCSARGNHNDHWLHYDPKETERDLDYAKKININQVRVFLSYAAYATNNALFRSNLAHLARACQAHGIGLMPVVPSTMAMVNEPEPYPISREWAKVLLDTIGQEPALAFWDVANEPDLNAQMRNSRIAHARVMAGLFRELDTRVPKTPTTIGFAMERYMEENGDAVDVLAFHDYLPTRDQIRANIAKAKAFAAKLGKPLINTEIGCTGRANPYDVTIEEYSNAHVGFYMWELMITGSWGTVHGIFYPDGTVRDPSIVAAMLGIFRNRGTNVILEVPDRENWVRNTIKSARTWLNNTNAPAYDEGLRLAETAANILEANQLVAMRELPTRKVALLRQAPPDLPALRACLTDLVSKLEPYQRPPSP